MTGERCEPPEVTWLRRYSNYLAPRIGLFSADALTLVTTWTRNVLLNLVIVFSLLALLFLVPRLLLEPAAHSLLQHSDEFGFAAAWFAFFLSPLAVSSISSAGCTRDDPSQSAWIRTTRGVVMAVIVPGVVATPGGEHRSVLTPVNGQKDIAALSLAAALLLALAGGGWLIVQLLGKRKLGAIGKEAGIFALAYFVALFVGYLLVVHFIVTVVPIGETRAERAANLLTFGPPALLFTFGVSGSLIVGIVGRTYFERSREWWGRMNAWFLTIGLAWLCLFGLSFYARPIARPSQ